MRTANPVRTTLDGTTIEFFAPRHRTSYRERNSTQPGQHYDFSKETFRSFDQFSVLDDSWKKLKLFFRSWSYKGSWFIGHLAELSLYIEVIRPTEPQAGVSFFHPRAFESAVASFLTTCYSSDMEDGIPRWSAPVNWTVIDTLPCFAVRLDVNPVRETHYIGSPTRHLFFPIADQYLVHFSFSPDLYADGYFDEREEIIDPAPINQLIDGIIASLKVTLSTEAQAQQAKALEGLSDTSLIKTFPPLKWGDVNSMPEHSDHRQLEND